jgi:uncharacterized protein (TIGR03086 family)
MLAGGRFRGGTMGDLISDYERAADGFAAVLAACQDDLGGQSPCEGWTGADVVDHVLGAAWGFTEAFGGERRAVDGTPSEQFAAGRAALVEAASAPGAREKLTTSPIGTDVPAAVLLGLAASDTLLHTWDLARASGQDVELDADLLERSWRNALPMDEQMRRPGIFGPKVDVPEDAPMAVQALAFFGRDAR